MENQHRKISGYRELSQEEIDLMNRIKAAGENLKQLCADVELVIENQTATAEEDADHHGRDDELGRLTAAEPQKWLEFGRFDLQRGIMQLVRAVAQPSTF